jgi:hypothetical protein
MPRYKRLLQALLLVFLALFVGQLLLLRNAGPLSPSPLQLGLIALAPLGVSVAFLLLWHASWFGQAATRSRPALLKLLFWLVAVGISVFWFGFFVCRR